MLCFLNVQSKLWSTFSHIAAEKLFPSPWCQSSPILPVGVKKRQLGEGSSQSCDPLCVNRAGQHATSLDRFYLETNRLSSLFPSDSLACEREITKTPYQNMMLQSNEHLWSSAWDPLVFFTTLFIIEDTQHGWAVNIHGSRGQLELAFADILG